MITIEKIDGEKIKLFGQMGELTNFLERHGIKSTELVVVRDNLISCIVDNEDNVFLEEYYKDYLDDIIFELALNMPIAYEKELDFEQIEHAHIIADMRYEMLEVIDEYIKDVKVNQLQKAEVLTTIKYEGKELLICQLLNDTKVVVMDAVNLIDTPEIGDVYLGELENDVFYADRIDSE